MYRDTFQKYRGQGSILPSRFRGCFLSRSDSFELRLQSLAICDFEVAAIRVTKVGAIAATVTAACWRATLEEALNCHNWLESRAIATTQDKRCLLCGWCKTTQEHSTSISEPLLQTHPWGCHACLQQCVVKFLGEI